MSIKNFKPGLLRFRAFWRSGNRQEKDWDLTNIKLCAHNDHSDSLVQYQKDKQHPQPAV